jgi:hypothetical protein
MSLLDFLFLNKHFFLVIFQTFLIFSSQAFLHLDDENQ